MAQLEDMQRLAHQIRSHVLEMTTRARTSHIGSNFSMAELLAVLYGQILHIDPQNPKWADRDRFILSKGHAAAALYAVLAESSFFSLDWLETFCLNGSKLAGHATSTYVPGIEISTGSLGHGLPVGVGMALAAKRDGTAYRVFVMLSDGECDEGSNWEAILFAPQHKLDNLVVIVDYNKIQSLGTVKEVMDLEPFADKWRAFNWSVREIDGHDVHAIYNALSAVPDTVGKPTCIIAHTVKGKGVDFMEDKLLWHYRNAQNDEYTAAKAQLLKNL